MKAVEHYTESEKFLRWAATCAEEGDEEAAAVNASIGQGHALLALAGATALQSYARVGDDDSELDDWKAAAGGES